MLLIDFCPFCLSHKSEVVPVGEKSCQVVCSGCGATGPVMRSEDNGERAVQAWNQAHDNYVRGQQSIGSRSEG